MKILFLHGWHSVPGGVKPTYLKDHGFEVINPALNDDDFDDAVATAQAEFDMHHPQVVVGSSRGGAVAMNIGSDKAKLVLLCPAWKNWGTAKKAKSDSVILHSRADDVIPYADSEELARNSGAALIEVGRDHRLADPGPLEAMLKACEAAGTTLKIGDVVTVQVRRTEVFGLFCDYQSHEILVLIPDISWIPSVNSCNNFAEVGDTLDVKILNIDRERNRIAGSLRAVHPENDPWSGAWQINVGDVFNAKVVRWVERTHRCGDAGGFLLALRPGAFVMLCDQKANRFSQGGTCTVRITSIDTHRHAISVGLIE